MSGNARGRRRDPGFCRGEVVVSAIPSARSSDHWGVRPSAGREVGPQLYGSNRVRPTGRSTLLPFALVGVAGDAADLGAGGADPVRTAARLIGTRAAMDVDGLWRASEKARASAIDVVDMFSGCGGMSAGFRIANALVPAFRHILAVDIDVVANETYEENLHHAPVAEDVSALARNGRRLRELLAASGRRPDRPLVMIGCAPCQGFSSHRNAAGAADSRNPLVVDFAKLAARALPDVLIMENVPELLTTRHWSYFSEARRILRRAGYYVSTHVVNMAEFGVPQERFRAVVTGTRSPSAPLRGFLGRPEFRTVREAIGRLAPIEAGGTDPSDPMHYVVRHRPETLDLIRSVPRDGGSRPPGLGPECLRRIEERQGRAGYEDIYGRLFWDRPSITVTHYARNPASGRFLHPEQDRGLSVREAALLQGFPADYAFAGSLDERFRQIGNAVPPPFAAYLAFHVLGELLGPKIPSESHDPGVISPVGASFSRLIPGLKQIGRAA